MNEVGENNAGKIGTKQQGGKSGEEEDGGGETHKGFEGARVRMCVCTRVCVGGSAEQSVKPVCGKVPQGWQLSNRVGIDPAITKKNPIDLWWKCVCLCAFPFLSFCSILLFCAIFGVDPHITFHPWWRVFLCFLRVLKVTCNTGTEPLPPTGQTDLNVRDGRGLRRIVIFIFAFSSLYQGWLN